MPPIQSGFFRLEVVHDIVNVFGAKRLEDSHTARWVDWEQALRDVLKK